MCRGAGLKRRPSGAPTVFQQLATLAIIPRTATGSVVFSVWRFFQLQRHSREGGTPFLNVLLPEAWIPAFAGMTVERQEVLGSAILHYQPVQFFGLDISVTPSQNHARWP